MKEIKIGDQIWASSNLTTTTFNNGDAIPLLDFKSFKQEWRFGKKWEKFTEDKMPVCAFYKGDLGKRDSDGVLYNWYAANDIRGICPEGWRIPTIEDWITLAIYLDGKKHIEKTEYQESIWYKEFTSRLKSKTGWDKNLNGIDEFGYNLKSLGYLSAIGNWEPMFGLFTSTLLWTSSELEPPFDGFVQAPLFVDNDMVINRTVKGYGLHVRCIKK